MILTCYAEEGGKFMDSIVTGAEACVYHHTPELNQWSLQWCPTDSSKIKKFETLVLTKKKYQFLVQERYRLNAWRQNSYCQYMLWNYETLRLLWSVIQNKRRRILSQNNTHCNYSTPVIKANVFVQEPSFKK